jgi:hypothetical protein
VVEGPPLEIWLSLQCSYSPVVQDFFKALKTEKVVFNNGLKMWLFSYEMYERVVREFMSSPFEGLHLIELPRFMAKGFKSYLKRLSKLKVTEVGPEVAVNIPPKLMDTLLPFQLEAVKFIIRRGGRGMLGDEMGECLALHADTQIRRDWSRHMSYAHMHSLPMPVCSALLYSPHPRDVFSLSLSLSLLLSLLLLLLLLHLLPLSLSLSLSLSLPLGSNCLHCADSRLIAHAHQGAARRYKPSRCCSTTATAGPR